MQSQASAREHRNKRARGVARKRSKRGVDTMQGGTRAAREIAYYQRSTDLLLQKIPFARVVRQVVDQVYYGEADFRWQTTALLALQEAAEWYLVGLLQHANLCCLHAKRITVNRSDVQLAKRIRGPEF